ncbi:MAG: hypothetical protein JXR97_09490 [Planctomycetes bacterium]|nr:hypothetical protein [Planctomycetota bacterium]
MMRICLVLFFAFILILPGCLDEVLGILSLGGSKTETNSELSLNDIGEKAMENAEKLEDEVLYLGALESYQRAQWAFEYYKTLTGRDPVYLGEAEYGVTRLQGKVGGNSGKTTK